MKMKHVTLGFSILALTAVFVLSCKPKANTPPAEDSEVQSAIDAVWATYVVTDLIQVSAFIGEDRGLNSFYNPTPESYDPVTATGSITLTRDLDAKALNIGFNKTKCIDGRFREGTVFLRYGYDKDYNKDANPNSVYYRDFGFVGRLTLSAFKVDGWSVETESYDGIFGGPVVIYNQIEKDDYDPAVSKLKWRIVGKFKFIHPTDPSKNMVWDGDIVKILTNSTDKKVFNATKTNKNSAITWSLGVVSYEGHVKGVTSDGAAYTMTLNANNPLVRDFTCFSDKVGSIALTPTAGVVQARPLEYHPFITGIAAFKTGTKYVRQIYFGNEGNTEYPVQCDNNGEINIKGISYRVDFQK